MSHIPGADLTNGNMSGSSGVEGQVRRQPIHANRHMRVICVGAGASGIHLAYKLKYFFTDFSLHVYEKNPDIGGTWYENRYPGCACDVPAHNYTFSFEPKFDWSANYASSSEIFKYFSDFVEKYDLRQYISLEHEVVGAHWMGEDNEWSVTVRKPSGDTVERRCDFLINAAGILNNWRWPAIPGLHFFKGVLVHSAAWDESLDVSGKHVGLIGNGSSGIQILPKMQKEARHVTTFIREPTWVSPVLGMEFHKYSEEEQDRFRAHPEILLEMRKKTERSMMNTFPLLVKGSASQEATEAYMRSQMKQKINRDELSDKLIPDFAVGCRRLTPGINYLENLTASNVTTVYGEIVSVTGNGCVTDDGKEHPVDVLICATGFDTTFKPRFPLVGRDGRNLAKEWALEPRSYFGLAVAGFPNYFMYLGPNCPIGNGPIIFSIEIQGEYISHFLNRWQKEDVLTFEPKIEAVNDFIHQKDLFMQETVWSAHCQSWYKDPMTGKITALWPGSTLHYMEALANPRYEDYNIEYRGGRRFAYFGMGFSQTELSPNVDVTYYIRNKDDYAPLCRDLRSTFNAKDITPAISAPEGPL